VAKATVLLGGVGEEGAESVSRGIEIEGGSGPLIEQILDSLQVVFGVDPEVAALGEPET
jgi:hypothetical protein